MAVSFNSVVAFTSTAKYQLVPSTAIGSSVLKSTHFPSPSARVLLRTPIKKVSLLVANGDRIATETPDNVSSINAEASFPDNQSSTANLPIVNSPIRESQFQASGSQSTELSNGSTVSSDQKQDTSIKTAPKRSRLTAREKLRAARVLSSRNTDSKPKPSKSELGSKVLEVMRESDRGKKKNRYGLPEAPENLLDDSKRGMPKKGLTFELPGGTDVFLIIFSIVFISTVMFSTTYIVWKVGAIHFNEY